MRWPLQPLQPFQQTQLQPPFGQSVASLCHPWFTTNNFSYRFPIFETSATALCGTTGISQHTVNGQKNKPYRHLPSKPPHPKSQCWTNSTWLPLRSGFIFCPPHPSAQPKDNIEIWGCRGDNNTARVWFHRPSTVCILLNTYLFIYTYIYI